MDDTIVKTLGDEFGLESKLFQEFVYYILEAKLKDVVQFRIRDKGEMRLTIHNRPNQEVGSIINDFARVFKPILSYLEPNTCSSYANPVPNHNAELMTHINYARPKQIGIKYVKPFENDYIGNNKQTIDISAKILKQAIKYKMFYIVNDFIKNQPKLIDNKILELVVKTHNIELLNACLPIIKEINPSVLDTAILEKQDNMIYTLLQRDVGISTNGIKNICKLSEAKKILTWVNLYGGYGIDIQKIIQQHVESERKHNVTLNPIKPDNRSLKEQVANMEKEREIDEQIIQTLKSDQVENIENERKEIFKSMREITSENLPDIISEPGIDRIILSMT